MLNERGNSLITVLVSTLVLTVLGLTIVAATIGGAERTELRESDIEITNEALQLADDITSELTTKLQAFSISDLITDPLKLVTAITEDGGFLDATVTELTGTLDGSTNIFNNSNIACVSIVDVTGNMSKTLVSNGECSEPFTIKNLLKLPNSDLLTSRAFDIVIQTKNSDTTQANIARTVHKRFILTPLPSFLQYALGANGTLHLNGSPSIKGNIFAGNLEIQDEAEYLEGDMVNKKNANSLYPAIYGDLYSDNPEISTITKDLFYKENLPRVKADSQFQKVDFASGYQEQKEELLSAVSAGDQTLNLLTAPESAVTSLLSSLGDIIGGLLPDGTLIGKVTDTTDSILKGVTKSGQEIIDLDGAFSNSTGLIDPVINASTKVLTHTGDIVITNVDSVLNIPDLIVDGDIYIIGNKKINLKNIVSTGSIKLVSLQDSLTIAKDSKVVALGDITIDSLSETTIAGKMFAEGNITLSSYQNDDFSILGTVLAAGDLTISGNEESGEKENDFIHFDSTIYANGASEISNLGISSPDNELSKQLILLSKGDLKLSRVNEFSYFTDNQEDEFGLPVVTETALSSLNAFLYTESNATLYGVGSSFFVNGGVFSNGDLTINAIRGPVSSIKEVASVTSTSQQDKLSRFIIDYNRDIILKNIDALPKPSQLRLITDVEVIE